MAGFLRLEFLRMLRNVPYMVFVLALPSGFYLLYTRIFNASGPMGHITWGAYYMVAMAVFGGIGAALNALGTRLAAERSGGWTRLLRTTPLSAGEYVVAKLALAVLSSVPAIVLLLLLGGLVNHIALPFGTWMEIALWVVVGAIPFAALGLLLGLVFDASAAQPVQVILWLSLAMLGGLWTPLSVLPSVFSRIAPWLPSFRAADLAWGVLRAGNEGALQDIAVLLAYTIVLGLLAALRYRRDEQREYA